MAERKGKVVLAMSGGVDSSVAASLLLDQGYDVIGCFMRLGTPPSVGGLPSDPRDAGLRDSETDAAEQCRLDLKSTSGKAKAHHQGCCSVLDAEDARLVAARLGIPLYVVNFREDFSRIMDYFVDEYHEGRTPNPCIRCNQWLKFGKLAEYAESIDADYVATGHYARTARDEQGRMALLRGTYLPKDQSYVLFGIKRAMLDRMLLPIGDYPKPQVRAMARERGLPVFEKPDSQEICFVPDNDYMGLIRRRGGDRVEAGDVVDTSGKRLGQHSGHQQFTIGQRRGLPIALGYPIYVVGKDAANNTVMVGQREDVLSTGLEADELNWLADPPGEEFACTVKIRSNSVDVAARVSVKGDDRFTLEFDEPQSAVTPGQAAVLYGGERVIGGGWIRRAWR